MAAVKGNVQPKGGGGAPRMNLDVSICPMLDLGEVGVVQRNDIPFSAEGP